MYLGNKTEKAEFSFDGKIFENSKGETILGVAIDNKLTFYNHMKELCEKTSHKISALDRISSYLDSS